MQLVNILNKVSEESPEVLDEMKPKVTKLKRGIRALKLRFWLLEKQKHSFPLLFLKSFLLFILFPVHLWGVIHNYIPYKVPELLIKPIKDKMFHSSFKFVISFLVFQFFYLVLFVLIVIFVQPWWLILAYIISIPLTGLFAFHYYLESKKIIATWRYNFMVIRKNERIIEMQRFYNEIAEIMDKIIKPRLSVKETD